MFETGPKGAHGDLQPRPTSRCGVMMYSTVMHPAATVYPDSDKIAVWTGNREDDAVVERSSKVEYFHGEV